MSSNMLTIDEAARQLSMSTRYVRRLIAERRIAFHKFGRSVRLAKADVVAFTADGRIEPITSGSVWSDLKLVG